MNFQKWWTEFIENNPLWKIEKPLWGDVKVIAKIAWQEGAHQEWEKNLKQTLSTIRLDTD